MDGDSVMASHPPATALVCSQRVPEKVRQKAQLQLQRLAKGERLTRKVKCGGKRGGVCALMKMDVGTFWRMLSRDQGQSWELMSHERYNKMITR